MLTAISSVRVSNAQLTVNALHRLALMVSVFLVTMEQAVELVSSVMDRTVLETQTV